MCRGRRRRPSHGPSRQGHGREWCWPSSPRHPHCCATATEIQQQGFFGTSWWWDCLSPLNYLLGIPRPVRWLCFSLQRLAKLSKPEQSRLLSKSEGHVQRRVLKMVYELWDLPASTANLHPNPYLGMLRLVLAGLGWVYYLKWINTWFLNSVTKKISLSKTVLLPADHPSWLDLCPFWIHVFSASSHTCSGLEDFEPQGGWASSSLGPDMIDAVRSVYAEKYINTLLSSYCCFWGAADHLLLITSWKREVWELLFPKASKLLQSVEMFPLSSSAPAQIMSETSWLQRLLLLQLQGLKLLLQPSNASRCFFWAPSSRAEWPHMPGLARRQNLPFPPSPKTLQP